MHRWLIRLGAQGPRRALVAVAVGLVALIAVGVSSAYVIAGRPAGVTASSRTSPNPTGEWDLTDTYDNVPPDSIYRTGSDTVTFTPTSPGVYTITNEQANGGGTSGVQISGDSFTYEECGASSGGAVYPEGDCPAGSGHFTESWKFDYTGSTYTATGSFQAYGADGSTAFQQYGTFTATGPTKSYKQVVLSGTVRKRVCQFFGPAINLCHVHVVPVRRQVVELRGGGRTSHTKTNGSGIYLFRVKRGSYTIALPGPIEGGVEPDSRSVHAHSDVGNLDFTFCQRHVLTNAEARGCDLVQIIGRVLDENGNPYQLALVAAISGRTDEFPRAYDSSDDEFSDRSGDFSVFAPKGTVTVGATGDSPAGRGETVTIDATRPVNYIAPLKLQPAVVVSSATPKEVIVQVGQMPSQPHTGDHFYIEPSHSHQNQDCTSFEEVPVTTERDGHNAAFEMFPNSDGGTHSAFCVDQAGARGMLETYTAVMLDSQGKLLAARRFTF
jgi:hypothetical protein